MPPDGEREPPGDEVIEYICFCCAARDSLWPITSASQFGPHPLLVEPDIAIGIDQSRMTQAV
jgi:hypothetical protein